MGETAQNLNAIVNLSRANVMVIDDNAFSQQLLSQMLMGFGVRSHFEFSSVADAKDHLKTLPVDLIIVDCDMPGEDGYDFVRWLRRSKIESNAYVPVVMVCGHTRLSQVRKSRDCGANYIVTRPLAPAVLLDRIVWIAREGRPFLETADYAGPDRRVREAGPPAGVKERRADVVARNKAAQAEAETPAAEEAG